VAGIVGTTQAMEAIKLIIDSSELKPLIGRIWTIDMHSMDTQTLSLSKNENCPTCSKDTNKIVLQYSSPVCGYIPEMTVGQVKENKQAIIIDVREIDEWNAGHIKGAKHIALSTLMQKNDPDLPTDCEIILYCQMGQRSKQAAEILKSQGYLNVINMVGGYDEWMQNA